MNHATIEQLPELLKIFQKYKKDVFPYLRKDSLQRKIETNGVVYEDGVVITYGVYKRKQHLGTTYALKGDAYISEFPIEEQGNGNASKVLKNFFGSFNSRVWLTVRAENERARAFYIKNGMKEVGSISWSDGKISGVVYCYQST